MMRLAEHPMNIYPSQNQQLQYYQFNSSQLPPPAYNSMNQPQYNQTLHNNVIPGNSPPLATASQSMSLHSTNTTNMNSPIQNSMQQPVAMGQYQQNGLVYYAYNQYQQPVPIPQTAAVFSQPEFYPQTTTNNNFNFNNQQTFGQFNEDSIKQQLPLQHQQIAPPQQQFPLMDAQTNYTVTHHPRSLTYPLSTDRGLGQVSMNFPQNLKDELDMRYRKRRHTDDSGSFSSASDMTPETAARNRCPRCQKQFKRPSSLQTHLYSHTGEKPFACTWDNCGRLFSVKSNMTRHMKLHERDAKSNKSDTDM